jgi:hypothetical protein
MKLQKLQVLELVDNKEDYHPYFEAVWSKYHDLLNF